MTVAKLLRMPIELKDLVESEAEKTGVSGNALILGILWDWFEKENKQEVTK